MIAHVRLQPRILLLGFLGLALVVGVVKWMRITAPEYAEQVSILPSLAHRPITSGSNALSHVHPTGATHETCPGVLSGALPDLCAGFTASESPRVHVVLKTGAGERVKTKAAVSTLLTCSNASDVTVVSDMEDEIEGHHVYDVLANLPPTYAVNNSDWDIYSAQIEAQNNGIPIGKTPEGWRLDRFKFLPMLEMAFGRAPHVDWYFFFEADIYFSWASLHYFVSRLSANERHYIGSAAPGANHTFFAYGGAGFLMSRRLMYDLLDKRVESLSAKYVEWVKRDCCGDTLLAYVLREELDVRVENAYPVLSGEAPEALPIGAKNWCLPVLSLHRVGIPDMGELWREERCRPAEEKPLLHSAMLDFGLLSVLENRTSSRSGWNNFSGKRASRFSSAHASASGCAQVCAADEKCMQWRYSDGRCYTADSVRYGIEVDDDDVISGWDMDKLRRLGYQDHGDSSGVCYT